VQFETFYFSILIKKVQLFYVFRRKKTNQSTKPIGYAVKLAGWSLEEKNHVTHHPFS